MSDQTPPTPEDLAALRGAVAVLRKLGDPAAARVVLDVLDLLPPAEITDEAWHRMAPHSPRRSPDLVLDEEDWRRIRRALRRDGSPYPREDRAIEALYVKVARLDTPHGVEVICPRAPRQAEVAATLASKVELVAKVCDACGEDCGEVQP